jgi:membrane fusion protein, copper/silver efflux system
MTKMRFCAAGAVLALAGAGCQAANGAPKRQDHGAHSPEADRAPAPGSVGSAGGASAPAAHVHTPAAMSSPSSAATSTVIDDTDGHANHSPNHEAGGVTPAQHIPAGYAAVTLDPARAAAVGLRLAPIEERDFSRRVRTTGVVVVDETRTSHVHAKVRGWIERVDVDFVGKSVVAGTPLCSVYSQEVLAAELEFLSILEQTSGGAGLSGPLGDAEKQAREQLVAAGRRRLALWDVPAAEIARLESSREPRRTFSLNAPRSGIVVAKQALAGLFIDPSVELYVISDIRKLWVLADVYASDVPGVKLGDRAHVSIEGLGAAGVPAEVAFLPPTVEESTRTLKVRFNLDNTAGTIRPGAFATVELNVELGRSLAVPEAAVIHAGRQAIVFVARGEQLDPRSVELGPLIDGYHGVQAGVAAGEHVAVGAQFLIDSESRLRATGGKGAGHAGH